MYTSDVHGNEVQYRKVVNFACSQSVDTLILGGDIAPKGMRAEAFIEGQRSFFEQTLPIC